VSFWAEYALLFAAALALTLLAAPPLIRSLRARRLGQTAYEDAPRTHAVKTGTPTMGGLLFIPAMLLALLVRHDAQSLALVLLGLLCGAVGFADDLLGIRGGRNRGLRARTKFLLTALAAVVFLAVVMSDPTFAFRGTVLSFGSTRADAPVWLWYVLGLCAVMGTTHAVNLTDGLDGLAAGTVLPPLALLAWLAARTGAAGVTAVDVALAAAALGFLWYNRHPAKVFMGDTGALALGGVIAGSAILIGNHLLLLLIGGVFLVEALSVILQVAFYKTTHRRILKMSPLHHHYELAGWPEKKITARFWAASLILSLVAFAVGR
jgi:phospho-N-acetylmuramoyl-pentapeptide-transferase